MAGARAYIQIWNYSEASCYLEMFGHVYHLCGRFRLIAMYGHVGDK